MNRLTALLPVLVLFACSNPGIVKVSPDTYLLVREDHAGVFGSMAKLKAEVIQEANSFAAAQGKVAVPISSKEKPVGFGPGQWASFEYQFRVVDTTDPEATSKSIEPRPDITIEQKATVEVSMDDRTDDPDKYDELERLDSLRRAGILTEAEFEAEKAKILQRP